MPMTAYAQKKAGDHAIGKAAWTMPGAVTLGLFSDSPGETGSLTSEVSGGSYARQALTAAMGAADSVTGLATNTSALTFPVPSAAWGLNLYGGIIDDSDNVLFYAPWPNPIIINNGDPALVIAIGAITVGIGPSPLALPSDFIISSYLRKKLLDHALAKASYTMPVGVFHGLLASNPTVAGALTSEIGVGGYARQALTAALTEFGAASGIASNSVAITYPDPTADYPSVAYSMVADAASAGHLLFARQFPSPLLIRNGLAPALFPAGSINLSVA